ncbi:hypothetical protein Q5P01_000706 [Channa striata]|uniref:SET domain-containing protein n=1 Tax=Channa striata TaxID=64152 RepID=A0AA88LER0_CHASR|nr:hypothetical protein Q5P01_000706 [Channa striata]
MEKAGESKEEERTRWRSVGRLSRVKRAPGRDYRGNNAQGLPRRHRAIPSTSNFSGVHCNMQQMGLYEKFPSETPILVEFKKYLVEHLEVPNCQQEVDNVSRMLRYMQPTGDRVNMDFLKKSTETKDYIVSLKRAKLLPATILNYIKNMISFVQFLLTRDVDDQDFHRGCQAYIMLLNTLRKPVSKAHSKVTYYEDKRGQGVIATRAFVKGAVICDYHGELVTAEEGRKILESSTDEMGYLFFFTSGSQQLCINTQTHPCRCHPTMETMGRKMNHSKNNLNVKPQHCKIKFPEGEKDTLLLVAARDIAVDEELRFDYGVNRKSFRGEGLDREWFDE